VLSGGGVAIACALAIAVIVPVSALRLKAENTRPSDVKHAVTKSDATVTVTPDIEAIEDYFLTKLGKYDKRADRLLREPRNGQEWYERAYDLYNNDRYEEAATAFKQAANEGYSPAKSIYNAACSYALMGDAPRATDTLERAIDAGWDDFEHIADDSDFDPIRSDTRFQNLVNRAAGDIATRRVTETLDRYESLKDGVNDGVKDGIASGISQGIEEGIREGLGQGISEGLREGLRHAFGDKDHEWFAVGNDLLRLRQLDKAIDAFQKSIDEDEKVGSAMYNIACAYSLKGDVANGMEWLNKSVENGFDSDDKFANDPDIAFLRQQRGFDAIRQKAKDLALTMCCDEDNGWDDDDERAGWRKAMEHHRRVAAKYPDQGRAWFNLGFTALQAREFATGHDAFQRAIGMNYRVGTSSYNIACGYALQNKHDAAFEWLDRAREAGFELDQYIDGDDDLDSLHDDPRWDALRREVRANRRWKHKSK
jgi:tetratricopeptide (TPR) repeat protein